MEQLLRIEDELNAIGYVNRRMYEDLRKSEENTLSEISMMCVTKSILLCCRQNSKTVSEYWTNLSSPKNRQIKGFALNNPTGDAVPSTPADFLKKVGQKLFGKICFANFETNQCVFILSGNAPQYCLLPRYSLQKHHKNGQG